MITISIFVYSYYLLQHYNISILMFLLLLFAAPIVWNKLLNIFRSVFDCWVDKGIMSNGETIPNFDSKLKWSSFSSLIDIILFLGSKNILLTKNLKQRTDTFIKDKLEAPSMTILKQWTLEDNPDTKWKEVKKTVRRFRNSLPIVSQNIPDGRATSARSRHLPKVFRAPAWVAADLGIWN